MVVVAVPVGVVVIVAGAMVVDGLRFAEENQSATALMTTMASRAAPPSSTQMWNLSASMFPRPPLAHSISVTAAKAPHAAMVKSCSL